jgi:serine/threonine protein phosphatase 1
MSQTLIVGDIHGCWDEFRALLDLAALGTDDQIVSVGDLVDRGPQSPRVLRFFRDTPNARAVMGNHERKHVRGARGETELARSQIIAAIQFGDTYADALAYMESLPTYLQLDDVDVVHGFYEPGVALERQRATVIVGTTSGENYLLETYERPWYTLYHRAKPLVVGHRNYLGLARPLLYPPESPRVYALDTSCVYGGALTGLLLPDFRILSVPSRANYWLELQREFGAPPED